MPTFRSCLVSLAETSENLFGIKIHVQCNDAFILENSGVSAHIYRIVQEALSNAVKYSQSNTITLSLQKQMDQLAIRVQDYGNGFSMDEHKQESMGIGILQNRAKITGTDLLIGSSPNTGTTVLLSVPQTALVSAQ